MAQRTQPVFEPRKSPVQARSTASVEALLEATIQVLLQAGKERLTTTRIAARAGVSVGTLYQYFPNKGSLLRAVLQRHLEAVASAVERVCEEEKGQSLEQMATHLVSQYMAVKMKNVRTSVAIYKAGDVEGARIQRKMGERIHKAIVGMLKTAREPLLVDPQLAASVLQGALAGVSRRLLESAEPAKQVDAMRQELILFTRAYLKARSAPAAV